MRNTEKDGINMAARRQALLAEGFRLFSEKGIGPVSLQEVAKAAGVGIATLYRYFSTKLDLVLAIGTWKWVEYSRHIESEQKLRHTEDMTAAEELAFYFEFFFDLYHNHKDLLRFNQDFNNYVQQEDVTKEQLSPYFDSVHTFGRMFHDLYEKGLQDGTIRTDIPEKKMFTATSHIMLAVAVRYTKGLLYSAEDESDKAEEFDMLRQMMLREYTVR